MTKSNFYKKLAKYYDDFVSDVVFEKYKEMIGDVQDKRKLFLGLAL